MKFFIDTADINEIRDLADTGLLDGVTTNPSLVKKAGKDFLPLVKEICDLMGDLPVSAEVASTDYETMLKEARKINEIADNIVIKVPLTEAGLKVCKLMTSEEGASFNVTLCFSPLQALLAAKAGADYISPFVGRLDDLSQDGLQLVSDIVEIYDNYDYETEIIVASIRNPLHILESAKMGADIATIPPKVIRQLYKHPLTDSGLKAFVEDWKATGQSIL